MGLDQFIPDAGDVLMCDFTTGFIPPEMTKLRKVIVLSPRPRGCFPHTYIVVPLSKTKPATLGECHCEFAPRSYDFLDQVESVWAKVDMISCVSKHRLDRVRWNNRYQRCRIRAEDLSRVRESAIHALGLREWHEFHLSIKIEEYKKTLVDQQVEKSDIDQPSTLL